MSDNQSTVATLICGVGCSGTSATAGVLHKLGCCMGPDEQLVDDYYENTIYHSGFFRADRPTQKVRGLLAGVAESERRKTLAASSRQDIYGIKHTLLSNVLAWFIPILREQGDDVRVVAVHRTFSAPLVGRSKGRCGKSPSIVEAERWGVHANQLLFNALAQVQDSRLAPIHHVSFEWLVENTEHEVRRLAEFAFDGLDAPSNEQLHAAIDHIDPDKKHH